jgi:hypothetical protein
MKSGVTFDLKKNTAAITLVDVYDRTLVLNTDDISPAVLTIQEEIAKDNGSARVKYFGWIESLTKLNESVYGASPETLVFVIRNPEYAYGFTQAVAYMQKMAFVSDVSKRACYRILENSLKHCDEIQKGLKCLVMNESKYQTTAEEQLKMFEWFWENPAKAEWLGLTFYGLKHRGLLENDQGKLNFERWKSLDPALHQSSLADALRRQDFEPQLLKTPGWTEPEWQKLFDVFIRDLDKAPSISGAFLNLRMVGLGTDANLQMLVEQKQYAGGIGSLLSFLTHNTKLLTSDIFRSICLDYKEYAKQLYNVLHQFEYNKDKLGDNFINLENYQLLVQNKAQLDDIALNLEAAIKTWSPDTAHAKFKEHVANAVSKKKISPSLTLFAAGSTTTAVDMKQDHKESIPYRLK